MDKSTRVAHPTEATAASLPTVLGHGR
jgi:hypothetical protein